MKPQCIGNWNMPKAIILDIEGTIGSISFVHDVLFPYSTERLLDYLRRNPLSPELTEEILLENQKDFANGDFAEIKNPQDIREIHAYLHHLIQIDRKFGPLKWIQGKLWKEGFELADLKAELYDDVPIFLRYCKDNSIPVYIYSSGSEESQVLFMQYSVFGDLREWITGYFDTKIGGKKDKQSYINIAKAIHIPVESCNFFTDILEEAQACQNAGWNATILNRPGNRQQFQHDFPVLESFLPLIKN